MSLGERHCHPALNFMIIFLTSASLNHVFQPVFDHMLMVDNLLYGYGSLPN